MVKQSISVKIPSSLLEKFVNELKTLADFQKLPSKNEHELFRAQINGCLIIIYNTGSLTYHKHKEIELLISKYSDKKKENEKITQDPTSIKVDLTNEQLISLEEKLSVFAEKGEPKNQSEKAIFRYKGSTIILYKSGTVYSPKINDKFDQAILDVVRENPQYTEFENIGDEKIKRRLDATEIFWQANDRRNFFHIPDLYQVDPVAIDFDPYRVPASFIPEPVGGLIEVYDVNGRKIEDEPNDFILMNFLPGGYKKRWGFNLYGALWESYDESKLMKNDLRFADISNNFLNTSKEPLSKYLKPLDPKSELFDLFDIPIKETDIYFPKGIRVEKLHDKIRFYWVDSINQIVHNIANTIEENDILEREDFAELSRDPSSFGLWFSLFNSNFEKNVKIEEIDLYELTSGLIAKCRKILPVKIIKCYYGNLLNIYSFDFTQSAIINFYHSGDERFAVIGSQANTHGIEFTLSLLAFRQVIHKILKDKTLKEELVFSYLYKQLWYNIFIKQNLISCSFDIDKIFEIFIAIDYWIKSKKIASNLKELFKQDFKEIEEILNILIPRNKKIEPDTRLKYLGYDGYTRDLVLTFFKENYKQIQKMINDIYNMKYLEKHGLEVLIHSFVHSLMIWSQALLNTNSESLVSHIDPIDFHADDLRIVLYDAIQGGSGVAAEFFTKLKNIKKPIFDEIFARVNCQSSIIEDILIDIISKESPDFLFDLASNDIDLLHNLVQKYLEIYRDANSLDLSDEILNEMKNRLALKIKSITIDLEMIVFYHVLAKSINKLTPILKRSVVITDVVLDISDSVFIDPRAYSMFKFYSTKSRGHISEIAYRCSEIVKQCVRACPDCLILSRCNHNYTLREYIIDRRMLEFLLKNHIGD